MDSLLSTVDQGDLSSRYIEQADFCTGRYLSEETFVKGNFGNFRYKFIKILLSISVFTPTCEGVQILWR